VDLRSGLLRAPAILAFLLLVCGLANVWANGELTFSEAASRAQKAREQNDLPAAEHFYRSAVAMNPTWKEGWWALGSIYYDSDRYHEAAVALTKFVALDHNSAAMGLLGLAEFENQSYPQSLEHISRALEWGVGDQAQMEGVLRFHQALLLAHSGNFDDALTGYLWFVQRGVHHDALLTAIGAAALHRSEFPDAAGEPERKLLLAVGHATFLSMSAAASDAQKALRELIESYNNVPYLHYLYGSLMVPTDRDEAASEMRAELKVNPSNGAAEAILSWLLFDDNQLDDAVSYARRAERDAPSLPLSTYVYGRSLVETGQVADGITYLENGLKRTPRDLLTHIELAAAYARAGLSERARREREVCLKMTEGANAVVHP
jgi:predicted Zn-dependent protease